MILVALVMGLAAADDALVFERQHLGNAAYESASAFDVDNDGTIDVFSGAYWYKGPELTERIRIGDVKTAGEYYDDFSNFPMDVNGDGYTDVITGGFWGNTLRWIENPKGQRVDWPVHIIGETGAIERSVFEDMDGDGFEEIVPTTGPIRIVKLVRDAQGKGTGVFETFVIKESGGGGHGLGAGDVNADGRTDLVFCNGWFEAPASPYKDAWSWHQEWDVKVASHPMLVHDVNKDGKPDIIYGQAHPYGLSWMEQDVDTQGRRMWTTHEIDPDRSQYHDLRLVDVDNDGEPELVTGKRYRAHNGHDPGAFDPLGVYYFKIDGGAFTRFTVDYGAADKHSGAGIFFWVSDIDGNGWKDIVAPGKQGLYVFRNAGPL